MRSFTHILLVVLSFVAISAAECAAKTVVVTAKPRFQHQGQFVDLIISDKNHSFNISWGMSPYLQFIPVSLETNRVYTFTVAQTTLRSFSIPELRKVKLDGRTIYDIEICEVHKTRMKHKVVRVAYGLIIPGPDEPSGVTERRLFPHRREISFGGCVSTPDSPKTERVYVCSECKKACDKWRSEHKKPQ